MRIITATWNRLQKKSRTFGAIDESNLVCRRECEDMQVKSFIFPSPSLSLFNFLSSHNLRRSWSLSSSVKVVGVCCLCSSTTRLNRRVERSAIRSATRQRKLSNLWLHFHRNRIRNSAIVSPERSSIVAIADCAYFPKRRASLHLRRVSDSFFNASPYALFWHRL